MTAIAPGESFSFAAGIVAGRRRTRRQRQYERWHGSLPRHSFGGTVVPSDAVARVRWTTSGGGYVGPPIDWRGVTPRVCVLDYGFGNVRSAVRAVEEVGAEAVLTADRATAEGARFFYRLSCYNIDRFDNAVGR